MTSIALEKRLLAMASFDLGWSLIERFSTLARVSGTKDERAAARWIADRLQELGVPHRMYEPDLYLSRPLDGAVLLLDGQNEIRAKPWSFSASTGGEERRAEAVYVPGPATAGETTDDIFGAASGGMVANVRDRIVVTRGYPMPLRVHELERAGAVGQVYVGPGEDIHWGICTPIWGSPTEKNLAQKPRTPVVAIAASDGRELEARLTEEGSIRLGLRTRLEEGWFPCLLPVAHVAGASEDFLLVHGHYDSWDVGIGDNAVGDATLLELARLLHHHRDALRRSVQIAWWPGHSTGRYAGSTWYADHFALELRKRCVGTVNIDSPGCRGATAYEEVSWMPEAAELAAGAIHDVTGRSAAGRLPPRAGDYSFDPLGLTSFFMLMSNIPKAERERRGYYPVGGCGGDIAWHTEKDTLELAARENLERDLRVYLVAIARVVAADILPYDYRATVRELVEALESYRADLQGRLDLGPAFTELKALESELDRYYRTVNSGAAPPPESTNTLFKELSRILVPLLFCAEERFDQDPALPRKRLPKLAGAREVPRYARERPEYLPFLLTGLRRELNKVINRLYEARRAVDRARSDEETLHRKRP